MQTSTQVTNSCPHIDQSQLAKKGILLADGQRAQIRLPVVNLNSLVTAGSSSAITLDTLECVMEVEEGVSHRTRATLTSDGTVVECDARAYSYTKAGGEINATLYLAASGRHVIDKTTGW